MTEQVDVVVIGLGVAGEEVAFHRGIEDALGDLRGHGS